MCNESHYKPERILVSNENIFKQRKKTLYSANQSELKSRDSCINQLLCITDDIYQSFYDFLETGIFRNITPNASPFLRPVIGRWAKDWEKNNSEAYFREKLQKCYFSRGIEKEQPCQSLQVPLLTALVALLLQVSNFYLRKNFLFFSFFFPVFTCLNFIKLMFRTCLCSFYEVC